MSASLRGRFRYAGHLHRLANNRIRLRTLRGAARYVLFVCRLAGTAPAQIGAARFFLRFIAAHLFAGTAERDEATLRLRGTEYILGLRSMEVFACGEIYGERVYDREPNFIPGPGWTVFDLGANAGLFSVLQARRGARVYALEPNPDCYRRLCQTVAVNGLSRAIYPLNLAIGRAPGAGTLRVPHGWSTLGALTAVASPADSASAVEVPVRITTLDAVVPTLGVTCIDLLKVDVEGAEVAVMQGAARTLEMVERIIVECHAPALLAEVSALLAAHGFVVVRQVRARNADEGAGTLYLCKDRAA